MVTQARALRTPTTRKAFRFSLSMIVIYRLGNCVPSRLSGFHILRQLSTDMVGSIHTDNSRIRNPDSQFRPKFERQNAARERKPIHLPPMQLREAFSCSSPFVFVVLRGMKAPITNFLDAAECASPSII